MVSVAAGTLRGCRVGGGLGYLQVALVRDLSNGLRVGATWDEADCLTVGVLEGLACCLVTGVA